jgi:hypothetical protein
MFLTIKNFKACMSESYFFFSVLIFFFHCWELNLGPQIG